MTPAQRQSQQSKSRSRRAKPPASPESQPPPQSETGQPSPSPSPEEDSGASSRPVSSAAEFVLDPGPAFNPKQAPEAPPVEIDEPTPGVLEEWDEGRIREALELQGEVFHALFNGGPADEETWHHTERDLRAIAPPLTRVLNRYDVTRAAAAAGDEALLVAAFSRYGIRNYTKLRRYQAAQRATEPEPATGVPAPEGSGPEHDEDWQRTRPELMEPPALTPRGANR
jgi:hypothetical protein